MYLVTFCEDYQIDYVGGDISSIFYPKASSPSECQKQCQKIPFCNFWTWAIKSHISRNVAEICFLKKDPERRERNIYTISGPKYCPSKSMSKIFACVNLCVNFYYYYYFYYYFL